MRLSSRLSIHTFILYFLSSWFFPAEAILLSRTDSLVTFESKGIGDFKCVCESTIAAVAFLKSVGLETSELINVRLIEHIPSGQEHVLLGAYNLNSLEVTLLTYPKAVKLAEQNQPMPGIELSEDLWCSYAAHGVVSRYQQSVYVRSRVVPDLFMEKVWM